MIQQHIDTFNILKNYSDKSTREMKQQRGRDFEVLIADVLEAEKVVMLHRSYHTSDNRSEQIDAAIELFSRIFLIEVKWVESNMAASELYAFIGKIENKFHGTLGIFISRAELSGNFIQALNKGRRQSVLVVHGEDLDELFKADAPTFSEYLVYCFKLLSYDNVTHFPVKSYLSIYRATALTPPNAPARYLTFIETQLNRMTSESDMLLAIEQLSTDEVDKVTDFTVKNYVKIWFTSLRDKKEFIPGNYLRFLELADPSAHYREKTAGIFFNELLKAEPTHYHRKEFLNLFSPFYTKINPTEKIQFETWLMQTFAGEFNVWDTENMLTEIVSRIWAELASKTRAGLAGYYLQFFLSESRQVKFAQKRFAIELLDKGKISSSEIERWLRQKLTEVKMNYNGTMPEEAITRVAVTYHPLKAYMDIPLDQWKGYIKKELDDISESQ